MERAIFISSVNRETIGDVSSHNFKIKFTPTLRLPSGMKHSLALDKLSMTHSWHNITPAYKNNTLKYSHDAGHSWSTITFPSGAYSYDDLNQFIKEFIMHNGHSVSDKDEIRFTFILTTYRIVIELADDFQLELRGNTFCELIGFSPKIITSAEYGIKLPNITNSVDALHILTDAVEESLVDGKLSDTMFVVPTDNLRRSYPFRVEPRRALFVPLKSSSIDEIQFRVQDALGRTVDLNGIDWHMSLILRSE